MIFQFIAILSIFGVIIFIGELSSKFIFNAFISRKLSHMACGGIIASLPYFLDKCWSIALLSSLIIIVILTKVLKVFKNIEGPEKENWGTLYFPLGALFSLLLFWSINPLIFSGSILILGFADSSAAIIGKKYGKRNYAAKKTLEGSLAFYVVSCLICLIVSMISNSFVLIQFDQLAIVIGGSLVLTIVEAINIKGLDNLSIPAIGGLILLLLIG
ncbi:MAG: hypothetical protein WCJ19_00450 [bacterium]